MTHVSASLRVESPCINLCELGVSVGRPVGQSDELSRICLGCGRHVDDIARWSQMTPLERHEANERADARRAEREVMRR